MNPSLPRPELVGFFGRDADHGYQGWLTNLRYITVDPKEVVPIDLSVDSENVLPYNEDDESFPYYRFLLGRIDLVRDMVGRSLRKVGVVTSRKELIDIWDVFNSFSREKLNPKFTPYHIFFTAILFKGVIYFFHDRRNFTPSSLKANKFYQSIRSETPDGCPNTKEVLKETENFYGVFEIKLKQNKLLYKSVIDGVLANTADKKKPICDDDEIAILNDLKRREFVKLKLWNIAKRDLNHIYAQNPWFQGFFSNASKMYFGLVVDDTVNEIQEYTLENFLNARPVLIRKSAAYFDFLDETLEMVKDCFAKKINEDHPGTDFDDLPIIHLKFRSEYNEVHLYDDVDYKQLPEWYIEEINKML